VYRSIKGGKDPGSPIRIAADRLMNNRQNHNAIYSDEELMLRIREGNVAAFDALYERYSKRLYTYFFRMLNFNKESAEDALQDLFMKIAETPAKFDTSRSFKTWVFSVASNTCKNFYRHRQVVNDSRDNLLPAENEVFSEDVFLQLAGCIDSKIFRQMLENIIEELPAEKKEAFILRYQEDKPIAEIALIQQCPEGSVKSRLYYTLRLLEEKLKMFKPVL
jgi:RNA polymerase sigma-70 factor, ECF subfamily